LILSSSQTCWRRKADRGHKSKRESRRKEARGTTVLQASSLFPEAGTPFPSIFVLRFYFFMYLNKIKIQLNKKKYIYRERERDDLDHNVEDPKSRPKIGCF